MGYNMKILRYIVLFLFIALSIFSIVINVLNAYYYNDTSVKNMCIGIICSMILLSVSLDLILGYIKSDLIARDIKRCDINNKLAIIRDRTEEILNAEKRGEPLSYDSAISIISNATDIIEVLVKDNYL